MSNCCQHYNVEVIEQVDGQTVLRRCPDCLKEDYEPISQVCPDCGADMIPFIWSRDGMDYEYALGCSECKRVVA